MSQQTILTLSNGKNLDLLNPRPEDIDFNVIAEHLGKEARFNGATPDAQYSVAQHSYLGADAILADGGRDIEAAYFLLHDAHEAILKDITTPLKQSLSEIAAAYYDIPADNVMSSFGILEQRADAAIFEAAGLKWPMPKDLRRTIKKYDLIMFVTEWRDLMFDVPHPHWAPYSGIKPLANEIQPLPWAQARAGWLMRAKRLLPSLKMQAAE